MWSPLGTALIRVGRADPCLNISTLQEHTEYEVTNVFIGKDSTETVQPTWVRCAQDSAMPSHGARVLQAVGAMSGEIEVRINETMAEKRRS